MRNQLIKHLIGISIGIILQLRSVFPRAFHNLTLLLLRLLQDGFGPILGLLYDLALLGHAIRILFGFLTNPLRFLLRFMQNLIPLFHDLIGPPEFLRQILTKFLDAADEFLIVDKRFFCKRQPGRPHHHIFQPRQSIAYRHIPPTSFLFLSFL